MTKAEEVLQVFQGAGTMLAQSLRYLTDRPTIEGIAIQRDRANHWRLAGGSWPDYAGFTAKSLDDVCQKYESIMTISGDLVHITFFNATAVYRAIGLGASSDVVVCQLLMSTLDKNL